MHFLKNFNGCEATRDRRKAVKQEELEELAKGTHTIFNTGAASVKVQRSNMIIRLMAQQCLNTMFLKQDA